MTSTEQQRPREKRARERSLDDWQTLRDEMMRPPTEAEAHRFGRSAQGDVVWTMPGADDRALLDVARALIDAGKCKVVHVLSGTGVYLER